MENNTEKEKNMFAFGKEKADQYGEQITKALSGRKISKRRDRADHPGGLRYEATRIGMDMWNLLEALEGMCSDGRAAEIDDSTYLVR